jgi:galactitol-specific phosphotransferase system IIC component
LGITGILVYLAFLAVTTCALYRRVSRRVRLGLVDQSKLEVEFTFKLGFALLLFAASTLIPVYVVCRALLTGEIVLPRADHIDRDLAPLAFWVSVVSYSALTMVPLGVTTVLLSLCNHSLEREG